MDKKRITGKYILIYTICFALLSAAAFLPFVLNGKCLVGDGDGQSQYILQLSYMGRWLRGALSGFLHGDLTPPRFDFTIGMGDDINSVVRFHPLDFLSVFVPEAGTELLYQFLIFLRLYLAGIAFSLYAFAWRRDSSELDVRRTGTHGNAASGLSSGKVLAGASSGASSDAALTGASSGTSSGAASGFFGSIMPDSSWGVLAGSMVYLFTGYTFSLGIVHPTYMSPLITLPLLLWGAERMMHREEEHRFVLFSVVTAISFISNYYFMYISSVAAALYVFVRFFQLYKKDRIKNFVILFVRFVCAYAVGALISCVTLLPVLKRYSLSYRSEHLTVLNNLLVYEDKRRYAAWLINLISPLRASGNGTHLNYIVLVIPALILLFVVKKETGARSRRGQERVFLRIASLVLLAFLLIPAGGFLLAAMNNENNRWVYLIALLCGGVVSFSFSDFFRLSRREKTALVIGCVVYDVSVVLSMVWMGPDLYPAAGAIQLTVTTVLILAVSAGQKSPQTVGAPEQQVFGQIGEPTESQAASQSASQKTSQSAGQKTSQSTSQMTSQSAGQKTSQSAGQMTSQSASQSAGDTSGQTVNRTAASRMGALLLCVCLVSGAVDGVMTFAKPFGNLTRYYRKAGNSLSWYRDSVYAKYGKIPHNADQEQGADQDSFYRVDGVFTGNKEDNAALLLGYRGIQMYNSVMNASEIDALMDTANIGLTTMLHIRNLDGRTAAQELASVRYYMVDKKRAAMVPYGYGEEPVYSDSKHAIYENQYPLSLSYGTDRVMSMSEYEKLTCAEREYVCLEAAVLSDEDAQASGADLLTAEEFRSMPGTETIPVSEVRIDEGINESVGEDGRQSLKVKKKKARYSFDVQMRSGYACCLLLEGVTSSKAAKIEVKTDGVLDKVTLLRDDDTYTLRRSDYLVNLGVAKTDEIKEVSLRFTKKGTYQMKTPSIVYIPMEGYEEKTAALAGHVMQEETIDDDLVTGSAVWEEKGIQIFSIPYSEGWSAEVDGSKAKLLKVDGCWMGLALDAGEHEIRLIYHTPMLREGRICSLLGLVLLIFGVLWFRRKRR